MKGCYLGRLSWDEAEPLFARNLPIVLPIGAASKEHGLHLPLENDRLLADGLTELLLQEVEAIALPTLTYGYYPAFVEYPGSVSLPAQVMTDTVVSICLCLHQQGARRFYGVNTGISTVRPLLAAQKVLEQSGIPFLFCDIEKATGEVEKRLQTQAGGTHADEMETSMMLYLCPDRVRMERALPDFHGDGPGGLTRQPHGPGVYSPTGAWGDPTLATRDKGKQLVEAWVAHMVEQIRTL